MSLNDRNASARGLDSIEDTSSPPRDTARSGSLSRRDSRGARQRNLESKRTPPGRAVFDPDPTAVKLDDLPGNGQPEPAPGMRALGSLGSGIPPEDQVPIRRSDSRTGIADFEQDTSLCRLRGEVDPSPRRGEFDGVSGQIEQNLT